MEQRVLDKGFVRLVERMGGDNAVLQAARVSYGSGSKGEEQDRKLINFLLKNQHGTPFEHALLKFHVKAPIFVTRQWFRHRLGTFDEGGGQGLLETSGHSINEISYRYTEVKEEFYVPDRLRVPAAQDKQASQNQTLPDEAELLELFEATNQLAYERYQRLIEAGVARELARTILPVATYTQFYWTCNARSLMNFLKLRANEHAQLEIRAYAEAIAAMFKAVMPWTFEAFIKYVWNGKSIFVGELAGQFSL